MERIPATRPTTRVKYARSRFFIVFKVFTKPNHKQSQTHYLNCNRHITLYYPRTHVRTKDTRYYGSSNEKDTTKSIIDIWRFMGHPVVYFAATRAAYRATKMKSPSRASWVMLKESCNPSCLNALSSCDRPSSIFLNTKPTS